eukprot:scaffold36499_cov25-Phaeocystis_antarctica.AAC.1
MLCGDGHGHGELVVVGCGVLLVALALGGLGAPPLLGVLGRGGLLILALPELGDMEISRCPGGLGGALGPLFGVHLVVGDVGRRRPRLGWRGGELGLLLGALSVVEVVGLLFEVRFEEVAVALVALGLVATRVLGAGLRAGR